MAQTKSERADFSQETILKNESLMTEASSANRTAYFCVDCNVFRVLRRPRCLYDAAGEEVQLDVEISGSVEFLRLLLHTLTHASSTLSCHLGNILDGLDKLLMQIWMDCVVRLR